MENTIFHLFTRLFLFSFNDLGLGFDKNTRSYRACLISFLAVFASSDWLKS